MKIVFIYVYKLILKFIYFFLKLIPIKNKIVFITRQSNDINIDFKLISDEIRQRNSKIKMVFICKKMGNGLINKIKYFFIIFKQMYHLATSKIAIIDSYCIPVSILNHKKNLFVLQIWHSIGKIKKSGYQTLDTPSGRNGKISKIMCMHKNYDAILVGSKAFDKFYVEGFNTTKDKLLHYGLPRIDYLLSNEVDLKEQIYNKYPNFKNKKIVLYAPTFRTYDTHALDDIIKNYDKNDFVLIVKCHNNQKLLIDSNDIYVCDDYTAVDLICVSDYVITDYSSISLEAAILNKKVLFYVYDYEKYMSMNGLNIDFYKLLPNVSSKNIEDLFKIIKTNKYDDKSYQKFRKKYLPSNLGKSTKLIVDYILSKVE